MSYTLRDLPLPVKVVATVFLMAVGVGYTSAMLQLHIQDAKSGKPMPTPEDVILKFTGKKKADPNAPPPRPMSRLEALITGEPAPISGSSMTAAFTTEDRSKGPLKFGPAVRGQLPEIVAQVKAQRKGEQEVFALWINAPDAERKAAYAADKFTPPAGQMPKEFTPLLAEGNAVKIKTLIDARCVTCHSKGGEKESIPLDTYECLSRFMEVPAAAPAGGTWVKVEEPISISKLTQSTHAHLLSFATLFSLTGLIFAFSSWPTWTRVLLGPAVVLAVFADVGLWWLARLCDQWGPYFAMGVMGTGAVAGLCLGAQITLSLFNMYGTKGKAVIALLFLFGALASTGFVVKLLIPALPKPKQQQPADQSMPAVAVVLHKPVHAIDKLLIWPPVDEEGQPIPLPADPNQFQFNGEGSMVPAFFEKDKDYKKLMESDKSQAEKDKMKAQRQGDLDAMVAWARSPEAARKAAYEADKFDLPGLSDRTITPDFVKDSKVRIKTLIGNRCATCHSEGNKQEDFPLTTYKELEQYLKSLEAPK